MNPIWQAATTRQRHFAYGEGPARRYYSEVLPMAALQDHSPEAAAALTAMVAPGERVWLFEEPSALDERQWRVVRRIPGFQMACDAMLPATGATSAPKSVMLDPLADAAEMNELKAIAFPGFFGMRTPQMGRYRGIRVDGELVAMAGERLALPGYREVSAICTHPAHLRPRLCAGADAGGNGGHSGRRRYCVSARSRRQRRGDPHLRADRICSLRGCAVCAGGAGGIGRACVHPTG